MTVHQLLGKYGLVSKDGLWPRPKLPVVTYSDIAPHLDSERSLFQVWLDWSADKRCGSGWYFIEHKDGWQVGYYPNGIVDQFDDAIVACAVFIQKELEEWRKVR